MNRKKKKELERRMIRQCPYCGGGVRLMPASEIYHDKTNEDMMYVCRKYPVCDAYVRTVPGTTRPMGLMANRKLRWMRTRAHRAFDPIYELGYMDRAEAYLWLSDVLGLPLSETHIGLMGEYNCQRVIDECEKFLRNQKKGGGAHAADRGANAGR